MQRIIRGQASSRLALPSAELCGTATGWVASGFEISIGEGFSFQSFQLLWRFEMAEGPRKLRRTMVKVARIRLTVGG